MPSSQVAPYGTWKSPLTAGAVAEAEIRLSEVFLLEGRPCWVEMRPAEGGRCVIVQHTGAEAVDLLPAPYSARTRVHEYGGGAVAAYQGKIYFTNFADQRLYELTPGSEPVPLTPDGPWCYAEICVDPIRERIICVVEDHSAEHEPENYIGTIPLAGGEPEVLAHGTDFVASPVLSPRGDRLAWLAWNHPQMPWDGTELWLADLGADGELLNPHLVAGGPEESLQQCRWSAAGQLHVISDRSGWWNLYRVDGRELVPLCPLEAEFGQPAWMLGMSSYDFLADGEILCVYQVHGNARLARLDPTRSELSEITTPYVRIGQVRVSEEAAYFIGGEWTLPSAVVKLDLATGQLTTLQTTRTEPLDPGYLSRPEFVRFSTAGGRMAFAQYYPPRNQDFVPSPDERPPLVVLAHGGPTGQSSRSCELYIQYFTSRGIAVMDVDYGGSTGYGRAYRELLRGNWGVVDVQDCAAAAQYAVEQGLADAARLGIAGGSAGGFTTLMSLVSHDLFRAGSSHFGLSDLGSFVTETHKFESRYLDGLVGPWPEARQVYEERSPALHAERVQCPVLFLQGDEDLIVPPPQTERMVQALRQRKMPVAYLLFAGEQHGFRRAENIIRSLEAELYFLGKVHGFQPADEIEPVEIENL